MKVNELRIGNYLPMQGIIIQVKLNVKVIDEYDPHGVIIVSEENFMSILKDIEKRKGIPITEEWLLKFGANKHGELNIIEASTYPDSDLYVAFSDGGDKCYLWNHADGYRFVEINYVHQLQNLYFALTGEELTLK